MGDKKFTLLTILFLFVVSAGSLFAQSHATDSTLGANNTASITSSSSTNNDKSSYEKALTQASSFLRKKNYSEARRIYVEAMALDPDAKVAKSKIEEIDGIVRKQQASTAKTSTSSALNRRDESYWKDKYAEIKSILAGLPEEKESKGKAASSKSQSTQNNKAETSQETALEKKNARSLKDQKTVSNNKGSQTGSLSRADSAVIMGDSMLSAKNYEQSLTYYKEAHYLKPNNAYAARMVANVESLLYDLGEKQKKSDDLKAKAEITESLDLANKAILDKNWQTAKDLYTRVLALNPVPSQKEFVEKKIETIDLELDRIAKQVQPEAKPVIVKKPKNKREARAWKKEEERSAILARGSIQSPEDKKADNDNDVSVVDYKILNQFMVDFYDATDIRWTRNLNYAQADFIRDGKQSHAYYTSDGVLIGSSTLLKTSELPLSIKRTFDSKYSQYKLGDIIHFEGPEEIAYYIAAEDQKEKVVFRALRSGQVSLFNRITDKNSGAIDFGIQSEVPAVSEPVVDGNEKSKVNEEQTAAGKQESAKSTTTNSATSVSNNQNGSNRASTANTAPIAPALAKTEGMKLVDDISSLNKSYQKEAIEYSRADLQKKYPTINFGKVPDGQLFDVSVDENKLEYGLMSDKVLKENSRLSFSDNNNDVRIVCQDVVVNGNNAYVKLLIDNNSDQDFLTGAIRFTFLKENGSLKKLNPRFISNFPVVMPGKKFAIVYVAGVPAVVNSGDVFVIDLTDRLKQTNLTIHIPGDTYNSLK